MSLSRFILINFQTDNPKPSLKQDTTFFFDEITSTLSKFLDYEITKEGKINLILCKNNLPFYSTFEEMQIDLAYEKNYQIIIEYNEANRKVLAFHDYFFSQSPQRNLYRVSMEYLYLHKGKYGGELTFNKKRLNDSITYGTLTEIALHNPANPDLFTRGLLLSDYINKYPPKETYKITKKISLITKESVSIPQINFDEFDKETMLDIMLTCGSFEVIGSTIEKLKKLAFQILSKTEEIFKLPEVVLKPTEDPGDFNGYKNIFEQTKEIVSKDEKGLVLHQQSYFYKPYNPRVPEGIDVCVLKEYYYQGLAILQCLYRQIAVCLKIDPDQLSTYLNDEQSVLTLKHYPKMNTGDIGIQEHSDYGNLTFVVSNERGLEIQKNKQWIAAPH